MSNERFEYKWKAILLIVVILLTAACGMTAMLTGNDQYIKEIAGAGGGAVALIIFFM